jgi:hypothetical protein
LLRNYVAMIERVDLRTLLRSITEDELLHAYHSAADNSPQAAFLTEEIERRSLAANDA